MPTSGLQKVVQHLRDIAYRQEAAAMTDGQLLERYLAQHDEVAFAVLVRRHASLVWNACRRILDNHHDAEDAFQATFLVLVRKAASIARKDMLANWLYGVAHRTALKAKSAITKRRDRERLAAQLAQGQTDRPELWSNLLPVLDQELSRLPDKYRACIVLCDLEGKTRKDAARLLRLPEGTVASRLTRGRALLADRLARHGLAVSGGTLATAVSTNATSACVPASVVWNTTKVASLLAAGQAAAAGAISANAAALTQGVIRAMFLSKIKLALAATLAVASVVTFGGGILCYQTAAGEGEGKPTLLPGPRETAKQEKKPGTKAQPGQKKDEQPPAEGEAKAVDILKAYNTNAARFDESFNDKRVLVTGLMGRISRRGPEHLANPGYQLELWCGDEPYTIVYCEFTDKDRKQLAQLAENQMLTIEGQCQVRVKQAPVNMGVGLPGFPGAGFGGAGALGGGLGLPPLGGNLGNPAGQGLPGFPGPQGPGLNFDGGPEIFFLNSKIVNVGKVVPPEKQAQ
jgi:RNA polymerase sigma factor (sigma-70 family)